MLYEDKIMKKNVNYVLGCMSTYRDKVQYICITVIVNKL